MAFVHGKSTAVYLDAINLSAFLNAADFSVDVDTADTTTFSSSWKTALVGSQAAKAEFGGLYDPTDTTLVDTIGDEYALTGGVLTVAPAGAAAIGDRCRLMSIASTTYTESSPVGGVVMVKWSVLASAAVGFGDILHPLAEDTNTTTGADKDDTSPTSTGWLAHLHVTAADGGSWGVKLQDAATTDWTDVSGGAFAAVTGADTERLLSATTTSDLRRHVRYVATRTGGSAGDGITFALGYARNR